MEMWGISFKNVTMTTNKKKWWSVHLYYDNYYWTFYFLFWNFKLILDVTTNFLKETLGIAIKTKNSIYFAFLNRFIYITLKI